MKKSKRRRYKRIRNKITKSRYMGAFDYCKLCDLKPTDIFGDDYILPDIDVYKN